MNQRLPFQLPELDTAPPSWSVPWSDLMMVMFILFVVLFVFATRYKTIPKYFAPQEIEENAERQLAEEPIVYGSRGAIPATVRLDEVYEQLSARLAVFEPSVSLRHDPDTGIVVTLHGRVFFPAGGSHPTALTPKVLDVVGKSLIATRTLVTITAYADPEALNGSAAESTWELAGLRAADVAGYFTDTLGLEPERFLAQSFALAPVAPALTPTSRERNERIEIWITGQYR